MFYPLIPFSSFKSTLYDMVFSVLGWLLCLLGGLLLIKYTFKTEMF